MTTYNFDHRFKGPFGYRPGRNGVDDTFDVICRRTGDVITSASYWEWKDQSEAIAYAITHALNRHYQPIRSRFKVAAREMLSRFQHDHPGPYSVLVCEHRPDHFEIGITDAHVSTLIVGVESFDRDYELIAYFQWLACILNKTFGFGHTQEGIEYHYSLVEPTTF